MPGIKVVKRTGDVVSFDQERIYNAISKAVLAAETTPIEDGRIRGLTEAIVVEIDRRFTDFYPNVENIQDIVEKHLVLDGLYATAKAYILYRAERQTMRQQAQQRAIQDARLGKLTVVKRDGHTALFSVKKLEQNLLRAADELGEDVDVDLITREVINNVYDEVPADHIERALVLASAAFIERHPSYGFVAARLLLQKLYKEVIGRSTVGDALDRAYRVTFRDGIREGVESGRFDGRLLNFDLDLMANSLKLDRDLEFQYLGIQTLYDRYFLRVDGNPVELPQGFWMRVAMGLAVEEDNPNERALEFYDLMSQLYYVPSTPTLFHSGTAHPQLSSCYLTTVDDDLKHIFKCLADNAQLSKWSGGIGNDWSNIRATGSQIHSTNVESQGVVPFLKIANDVTMAINRSGKRRGATCAYMETWHYDIEDFLDLRKNTGDERRRTHDMNTASWIPDLFMKRVMEDGDWTLFSPDETADLHHIYGREFERAYVAYEQKAKDGQMRLFKTIRAKDLWRKMLTMLFETGHPWMTFKDPCNIRSPQDHVGVIHSSNLCTEITLNTSATETAVCNLGSINLSRHVTGGDIDTDRLAETATTAMRMLDNVIDINYYPTDEAKNSNLQHRPVGLGVMGFQDALYQLGIPFESQDALDLADRIQEIVSYHAIFSSSKLAADRGSYPSYEGSKWSRGLFPFDTLELLEKERGIPLEVNRTQRLDWGPVKQHVAEHGMRNSNTMAIAPTATISNISGCFPCIEAIYKNIYVKANISGEFTIVNQYLVADLEALGLWNDEMLDQLKYYDGSVQQIAGIPDELRAKYKEAFEVSPMWALRLTAARAKWIDQSQSHNVFMKGVSGKLLSEIYMAAWRMGIKTTYYLRSLGASQVEKSTLDAKKFGYTQKREYDTPATTAVAGAGSAAAAVAGRQPTARQPDPKLCRIDDPDCEACQ